MADLANLHLHARLHPSLILPHPDVKIVIEGREYSLPRTATVEHLMNEVEDRFVAAFPDGDLGELELLINVLWNPRNPKKALPPNDCLAVHFIENDCFGIHGEFVPSSDFQDEEEIDEESKVPIIVLTGFLGAGKTTLLNYILQRQHEKKIAVIENEFGEVAIDDSLLKNEKIKTAENVVLMDNGCMCCTLRGDLEQGLRSILDMTTQTGNNMDAVIIETTGMADPVPIVRTIKQIPHVMAHFRLDGVITVADAKHLELRLKDSVGPGKVNEAYNQIAFADRVLVNKIDLVTPEEVIQLQGTIRKINRLAKMIPCVRGQVNLPDIMGLNAHSLMHFRDDDFSREENNMPDDIPAAGYVKPVRKGSLNIMSQSFGGMTKKESRHSVRVGSFSIVQEGEIHKKYLCMYMQVLQNPHPSKGEVFRFKAILAVRGMPEKVVLHAVRDVVEQDTIGSWQDDEPRVCKMVFIGQDLDEAYFRDVFNKVTR